MGTEYRILHAHGEKQIPGVSISLLEYLLGEERIAIKDRANRSLPEYIEDLAHSIRDNGVANTFLTECLYYPLLSTIYFFV